MKVEAISAAEEKKEENDEAMPFSGYTHSLRYNSSFKMIKTLKNE